MKVQFYGDDCFSVKTKANMCVFYPTDAWKTKVDIAFFPRNEKKIKVEYAKKTIDLPGEFETSGVLVRGFLADDRANVIYKVVMDDISSVYFGNLQTMPSKEIMKKIGENIDIVFINLNSEFHGKKVREFLETLDPRFAFLGGDTQYFPKMVELGAKNESELPALTKSMMQEEKLDIVILPTV